MTPTTIYILNEREQDQKLHDLVPVQDDGWIKHFVEPETGIPWVLYWPRSEEHGGGPRFLRRGTIPADTVEWAVALLRRGNEGDAIGAGTDFSSRWEVWPDLLDRLEAEQVAIPASCIRAFIESLGVLQPRNLRSVIGKTGEEIEADATYFRELARRALVIVGVS